MSSVELAYLVMVIVSFVAFAAALAHVSHAQAVADRKAAKPATAPEPGKPFTSAAAH